MAGNGESGEPGEKATPEEVARLKAENEALKAKVDKASKKEKRGGFWRRFTVWLLIILACIFSVLGAFSVWVKTTTLDTTTFVNTVAPLVKDPAVAKAVSDKAVEQLFTQYDVTGRIQSGLGQLSQTIQQAAPNLPVPDVNLSAIAAPISKGLQSAASTIAQKILTSDAFYKVWTDALTATHTAVVNIVTGKSNAVVTSQGNNIILNLGPLLDQVKTKLADAGLGFLNKVQVPANFGQITLFTADQLGVAKGMVHLLETLSWVLPLLAFIFFALALVIAKDRRKVLLREGIGLAIAMLIVLVIGRVAHNELLGLIKNQESLAAANVVWMTILHGLKQALFGLMALGVVVAVGAGVAGPSKWALWTREHVGDFFKNWRERREGKKGKTPFMEFMDKYAWWFRVGGLVVAVLFLATLPHVSGLSVILTVVVLLIYLGVIEVLR